MSCGFISLLVVSFLPQVESKRLIADVNGSVWLRIEDAGYMDKEGRIWLVGRVKWRVERNGNTYWSTVIEQKVGGDLAAEGRCSFSFTFPSFHLNTHTYMHAHKHMHICTQTNTQILDRCSLITFAAYLPHPHNKEVWLFLEAPDGLPDHEKAGTCTVEPSLVDTNGTYHSLFPFLVDTNGIRDPSIVDTFSTVMCSYLRGCL